MHIYKAAMLHVIGSRASPGEKFYQYLFTKNVKVKVCIKIYLIFKLMDYNFKGSVNKRCKFSPLLSLLYLQMGTMLMETIVKHKNMEHVGVYKVRQCYKKVVNQTCLLKKSFYDKICEYIHYTVSAYCVSCIILNCNELTLVYTIVRFDQAAFLHIDMPEQRVNIRKTHRNSDFIVISS